MPKIRIQAKEGSGDFELYPKGTYDFQMVEVSTDQSKKDGAEQQKIVFEIMEGDYQGKKVHQWFPYDEKLGWRLRSLADACDVQYEVVDESKPECPVIEIDTDDFLQRVVRAELSHYVNKEKDQTYHNLRKFEVSPLNPDYDALIAKQQPATEELAEAAPAAAAQPAARSTQAQPPRRRPPTGAGAKA